MYTHFQLTNTFYSNILQSTLLKNLNKIEYNVHFLPASKNNSKLISNELFYAVTFTYVTFAAMWDGRFYLIAVDYNRYAIFKF
jgi:hypothetical protein